MHKKCGIYQHVNQHDNAKTRDSSRFRTRDQKCLYM